MEQELKPWQGVDGIVVVNMDTSPERFDDFCAKVGKYLPQDRFERLSAVAGRELSSFGKPPWFTEKTGERARFWGGTAGCTLSHRNALRLAKERGWRNILIFEDDAVLPQPEHVGLAVAEALRTLSGKYLFYLGYTRPSPYGQKLGMLAGDVELWKTEGVLATHAYLVPQSMYEPLLALLPEHDDDVWAWLARYRAIDAMYRAYVPAKTGASVYVMHPLQCVQALGMSVIGGVSTENDDCNCYAGPIPCYGVRRFWRWLTTPLRRFQTWLNSLRTRIRAVNGGLPGFRNRPE
jgi:hypothetical protein